MNVSPILIPILGVMIPIVVVPTALIMKHLRFVRHLEHAERMRALEVGRTLPQDEAWWSPPKIIVAIGAGVPVASLVVAFLACESMGFRDEIWGMSTAVALTAVVSGSVLAGKHFNHRARQEAGVYANAYAPKPTFDADAYDVVGRRG